MTQSIKQMKLDKNSLEKKFDEVLEKSRNMKSHYESVFNKVVEQRNLKTSFKEAEATQMGETLKNKDKELGLLLVVLIGNHTIGLDTKEKFPGEYSRVLRNSR